MGNVWKIIMVSLLFMSSSAMAKEVPVSYDVDTYSVPDSKTPHKLSLEEINAIDKSKWKLIDAKTVIVSDDETLENLRGNERFIIAGQDNKSHNLVRVISRHKNSR